MKTALVVVIITLVLSATTIPANAGPIAYGICQSGCSELAVACYTAGGYVFGTVTTGAGVPAVILGCNSGFGVCSAHCATVALFAPTL